MAGVKGRSGGHNRKTQKDHEIINRANRCNRKAPARIPDRVAQYSGLGDIGQAVFAQFEPMLHNNGTLSASDAVIMHAFAKRVEDWFTAAQECDTKGRYLVEETKYGTKQSVAPWARQETVLFDQMLKACRELGLTPVSRGAVERLSRGDNVDPLGGIT